MLKYNFTFKVLNKKIKIVFLQAKKWLKINKIIFNFNKFNFFKCNKYLFIYLKCQNKVKYNFNIPLRKNVNLFSFFKYEKNKLSPSNSKENTNTSNYHQPLTSGDHQHTPQAHHHQDTTLTCNSPKCGAIEESLSSNEKDTEYLRVIFAYNAPTNLNNNNNNTTTTRSSQLELSVEVNEVVKLIEDDPDCLDSEKSWIKVFNSQGLSGMIPSKCVEPIILDTTAGQDFVFLRRPTCVGALAYNPWYFGNITRFETIMLLNKYAQNGDYLVRDSDVSGDFKLFLLIQTQNKT